ncbi:hypothetical protein KAZ92_03775 [Candidatus Gracilibacteria bacterium]|nr:hypothetical protein [Candidatus Gracilibacteria bacterium]
MAQSKGIVKAVYKKEKFVYNIIVAMAGHPGYYDTTYYGIVERKDGSVYLLETKEYLDVGKELN